MVEPAWVALSLCKHMGGKTFRALMRHFDDDLHAILKADEGELRQVRGVGVKIAAAIRRIDLNATETALCRWQGHGVNIMTWNSPGYPPALKTLEDAPPTLFSIGQMPPTAQTAPACAIIGTRRPTLTARHIAQKLSMTLAEQGVVIVSGLAVGVDSEAHMGALAVPGGLPLAVLGCGILNVYPPENRSLAAAVAARGGLLSEVAPEATVSAAGLVARNRLITGLCGQVIIVESEQDGGAMHAARFAQAQGRRLYAVDSAATGNRYLIESGAAQAITDLNGVDFP